MDSLACPVDGLAEKAIVNHPRGFFSGDLNPHFSNYPTLQLYLAGVVYLGYWWSTGEELLDFVAWHTFVDDGDILLLKRGLTSWPSSTTVSRTAMTCRRCISRILRAWRDC